MNFRISEFTAARAVRRVQLKSDVPFAARNASTSCEVEEVESTVRKTMQNALPRPVVLWLPEEAYQELGTAAEASLAELAAAPAVLVLVSSVRSSSISLKLPASGVHLVLVVSLEELSFANTRSMSCRLSCTTELGSWAKALRWNAPEESVIRHATSVTVYSLLAGR